jgi:hypothetical protein
VYRAHAPRCSCVTNSLDQKSTSLINKVPSEVTGLHRNLQLKILFVEAQPECLTYIHEHPNRGLTSDLLNEAGGLIDHHKPVGGNVFKLLAGSTRPLDRKRSHLLVSPQPEGEGEVTL